MLADDHRMLREGLRRSMSEHGFDVVGEASDGAEAVGSSPEGLAKAIREDLARWAQPVKQSGARAD